MPSLLAALDDPFVSEPQPVLGRPEDLVAGARHPAEHPPNRGTPFFGDADGISKTVQAKFLHGDYPSAQRRSTTRPSSSPSSPDFHRRVTGRGRASRGPLRRGERDADTNAHGVRLPTPYLLVFAGFWIWLILYSFYLSFSRRGPSPALEPSVTWGRLLVDPAFLNALKNTLMILVIRCR